MGNSASVFSLEVDNATNLYSFNASDFQDSAVKYVPFSAYCTGTVGSADPALCDTYQYRNSTGDVQDGPPANTQQQVFSTVADEKKNGYPVTITIVESTSKRNGQTKNQRTFEGSQVVVEGETGAYQVKMHKQK